MLQGKNPNVARPELTPDDIARGVRMRQLRDHWRLKQSDIVPGNHTQVINVEKGRNKLTGPLLLQYAEAFGVSPQIIASYAKGESDLKRMLLHTTRPPGATYSAKGPGPNAPSENLAFSDRRLAALAILTDKHRIPLREAARALDAVVAFDQAEAAEPEHWAGFALKIYRSVRGEAVPDQVITEEFTEPTKPRKKR